MKKTTGLLAICISIICLFFVSGCKKAGEVSGDKLKIVTSFFPVYVTALNIADGAENIELTNLTPPSTGCLHDYQLSPQDMISLEDADIFIANGAGMESFIDNVIKRYPDLRIIYASDKIELKNGNPHVWVSPDKYIQYIKNIATGLSDIDSNNKAKYESNADNYIREINELINKMTSELKDLKNTDVITFHEAFTYFGDEFGLNIVSEIQREPGTEPNAQELAQTIELVKENNIKVIFAEPQYSQGVADTIANETGAKVYTLDPVVTGAPDKDAYISAMELNLKVILEACK